MARVYISEEEFWWCAKVGRLRWRSSSEKGLNHASTYTRSYLERQWQETEGCVGELALCKYLGKPWPASVDTFHRLPDVYGGDVRATWRKDGCLVIRDNDPDDRRFALVTGSAPVVEIRGWLFAGDCKQDRWLRNPHGHRASWFVPQEALNKFPGD